MPSCKRVIIRNQQRRRLHARQFMTSAQACGLPSLAFDPARDPLYNSVMKIKLISCEALAREAYLSAAGSPHVIDTQLLPFGLHNTPDDLRATIQSAVDDAEGKGYEAIILGYGLCSRGTAEIQARSIPIAVIRMHDCITAFLGSRARYTSEFSTNPGTYYYSPGWIERKEADMEQGFVDIHAQHSAEHYKEYVEKYGEDNAKFLIEQEQQWFTNYTRAAFINMGFGAIESYRQFTQDLAKDRGWDYSEIEGDMSLIKRLLDGDWDSEDFLVAQPGERITESFDEKILKANPA